MSVLREMDLTKLRPSEMNQKEWREKRKTLIKDHCEQCGTKEGKLRIHLIEDPESKSWDKNIRHWERHVAPKLFAKWMREDQGVVLHKEKEVLCCPWCSRQVRRDKKRGVFVCPSMRCWRSRNGQPIKNPIKMIKRFLHDYRKFEGWEKYWKKFLRLPDTRRQIHMAKAADFNEWDSFEHAKTFCDKCAYLWNTSAQLKLCKRCGVRYHKKERLNRRYSWDVCWHCAVEEGLVVLCKVCFQYYHSRKYEMCRSCAGL